MILKPSQSFFVYCIQNKEKILQKKGFLRKRGVEDWTNKEKKAF